MSDSLRPHELQHARPPCPSPTPGVYSNSCPLSQWCHPAVSSSVIPFSSCFQSFPASGSFQMSQLFASDGQRTGASASASVLPMNIQGWLPLELTAMFHYIERLKLIEWIIVPISKFTQLTVISERAVPPHSSALAWRILWTEEPGRLQSTGLLRVGHDWVTSLSLFIFMH